MNKQTIVITGGYTGLGLAATRQLLTTTNTQIVWAVRSVEAARQAAANLNEADRIHILSLDLSSLSAVRRFATELSTRLGADAVLSGPPRASEVRGALPPLGALVCNAGVQFVDGLHRTKEGIEETFGVNHLAHFLLVELLLPWLSPQGRVVMVSSGTHFDAPQIWQSTLFGMPAPVYLGAAALARGDVPPNVDPVGDKANQFRYVTSKLCNLLFTYELDRRLRETNSAITVTAFDPGLMPGTGLARANSPVARWAWNNVMPILRLFKGVNSVQKSGNDLAWLTANSAVAGVSGAYFEERTAVPSSPLSHQTQLWADLWQGSEQLVANHPT